MVKKIINAFTSLLLVCALFFLGFAIYTTYTNKDNPDEAFIFGYKPIYILTGSMEPTLKVNGVAIVKQVDEASLEKDDIIMFKVDDKIITHRIVSINNDGITTKGDNNNVNDAFKITFKDVRGKVILTCNWVADIVNYCQTPAGMIKFSCFVILSIVLICAAYYFIKKWCKLLYNNYKLKKLKNKESV